MQEFFVLQDEILPNGKNNCFVIVAEYSGEINPVSESIEIKITIGDRKNYKIANVTKIYGKYKNIPVRAGLIHIISSNLVNSLGNATTQGSLIKIVNPISAILVDTSNYFPISAKIGLLSVIQVSQALAPQKEQLYINEAISLLP